MDSQYPAQFQVKELETDATDVPRKLEFALILLPSVGHQNLYMEHFLGL